MEECISYLYNILIYSGNTKAEHQAIVEKVLQHFTQYGLAVNFLKSEFHVHKTIFLKHVMNRKEVQIYPPKLKSMFKWPILTYKKEVQA